MSKTKMILTIFAAAGFVGLLCASASAQQLYVDGPSYNDIFRFDASLNAAPAPGQSGALFIDLPSTRISDGLPADVDQDKNLAAGPDGFLYFVSRDDRPAWDIPEYQWGEGSNYVRRVNMATGVYDSTWKVQVGGPTTDYRCGYSVVFAPDGRLYVVEIWKGQVYLVDIATQTSTAVTSAYVPTFAYNLAFDDTGRAYVSSYNYNRIDRFTVSGTTWTRDDTYEGHVPTNKTWTMAYRDGWLYVNDYKSNLYRLDSSGAYDPTWKVEKIANMNSGDMCFGPDGLLYVGGYAQVTRVDVTSATPVAERVMDAPGGSTRSVAWSTSNAVPPDPDVSISYQGKLPDANDGTASIKFDLFGAETGGTAIWSGTASDVTVTDGVFAKSIGPVSLSLFQDHSELWLQVTANGQVMSPRVKLETAPYAARSFRTMP